MYQTKTKTQKIKDLQKDDRPREKLMKYGAKSLTNTDLLAIIIGTGFKGKNVIQVSNSILKKYPVKNFQDLEYNKLIKEKGLGQAASCRILAALEIARRAVSNEEEDLPKITNPQDVYENVKYLANYKKEYFVGLYLNTRGQLIHQETISVGIVNESLVHPREVFEPAIRNYATTLVLAHNHPSGDLNPSEEDIKRTQNLVKAGEIIGINVMDHLIVTSKGFVSMKDGGVI